MQLIDFKGWKNCFSMKNQVVELIMTTEVGPRLLYFGFLGQENEFYIDKSHEGQKGGQNWRLFGGHRLWHAPESRPRTYYPDNQPIETQQFGSQVSLIQQSEGTTGVQKEIIVELHAEAPAVKVVHRLYNRNLWENEMAPWAISVMAPGGVAIVPLLPKGDHEANLTATHSLSLWSYTNMQDPRWTWGNRYVLLKQSDELTEPQKVGVNAVEGWGAYVRDQHLFVKCFQHQPDRTYPDRGCSLEMFTNAVMLEVESLAPLSRVPPQQFVEHVEYWHLFDQVPVPNNDEDVDKTVLPLVQKAQSVKW